MGKVVSKRLARMLAVVFCILSVMCSSKVVRAQEKTFSVTTDGFTIVNNVVTAFSGNKELTTEVVIPKEVTAIGDGVFQDFSKLETIVIPDTVTSFGKGNAYYRIGCKE